MRLAPDSNEINQAGLDALETLGNEHRLAILRALAEAEDSVAFSELRRRVGIEDTGQFNYHLTELCGQFVREDENGYRLGYAGERVVLAAADIDPEAVRTNWEQTSEGCPVCGDTDCDRLIHVHLDSR